MNLYFKFILDIFEQQVYPTEFSPHVLFPAINAIFIVFILVKNLMTCCTVPAGSILFNVNCQSLENSFLNIFPSTYITDQTFQ